MKKHYNLFNDNLSLMGNRLGIYEKGPEYMKRKEYIKTPKQLKNDYVIDGLND
jgi:hypothetical protein